MNLRVVLLVLPTLLFPVCLPAQQTGEALFGVHCARCHATVEIERRVRNDWSGHTASQLFERTRQTMPAAAPGSLSDADYLEVLAYMLDIAGIKRPAGDLTIASLGTLILKADAAAGEGEEIPWRNIHGELNANRYAPLDQINADNAQELELVWRWQAGNYGPTPEIRSRSMPIMHHGRLFLGAGTTRNIVSLDAETGQTLWMWRPDEGERYEKAARKSSGMGVAYWEGDDGRRRVITVTPGYNLVSLNAATGLPDPEFGAGGWVDLTEGLRLAADRDLDIGLNAPPLVVGDVIVVGAAHGIGGRPPLMRNVKGDIRGFDARSGELLWTFHTIPEPGEPGYETWYDGSADYTGNAGVWAPMSADPELGLVYLPVEAPTGDYYGGPRHGANLYANSLVALDVISGELRWYYQLVHHDIWDLDNPTAPILADLPNGRKLVVQVTKQNFAYVFDRATGEPVWPIEERPVPQTDVPGEWTSPTQPFPTKPAPYDRQGLSRDDLIGYTPEIRVAVEEAIADYRLGPLYTPSSLSDAPDGTKGTLGLPFATGGANFEGSGYDPETGILYVPSATYIKVFALTNDPEASDIDYIDAGTNAPTVFDLLLTKPPLGRITAIDLTTGDHVWMIANGDTPQAYKDNPALEGIELPRTGKPTRAGIVVTRSLLFAGEGVGTVGNIRGDPVFRAHDKQTGEILAEIELPATQSGPPSTYMLNGRQYIVMMVMDGESPAELIALALPWASLR
ncbi:MAG: PQQ-binding-like beta-propeller repeat protein [Proteobacteria bacterium]|nr:PQQ-binding-like beta-propeller repeat protein [Pseudomonadota bacterium]